MTTQQKSEISEKSLPNDSTDDVLEITPPVIFCIATTIIIVITVIVATVDLLQKLVK